MKLINNEIHFTWKTLRFYLTTQTLYDMLYDQKMFGVPNVSYAMLNEEQV